MRPFAFQKIEGRKRTGQLTPDEIEALRLAERRRGKVSGNQFLVIHGASRVADFGPYLTELDELSTGPSFFDNFSRKHQGWLATLEIMGADIGAQIEERELAFEGITGEANEAHGNTI